MVLNWKEIWEFINKNNTTMEEKRTLGSYLKECEQLVKANSVHIESIKNDVDNLLKRKLPVYNWYISKNHYVEVSYEVIPKQEGDWETPSYPQYVEVSSMSLYGDDVTELFEHRIEEIEYEINNEME